MPGVKDPGQAEGRTFRRFLKKFLTGNSQTLARRIMQRTAACNLAAEFLGRLIMTLCPVALAVGCIKCPVVNMCPAKEIIGDYKKDAPPPADEMKKQ
jgi:hypothetical protein